MSYDTPNGFIDTVTYLQVEPSGRYKAGRVVAATQKRPAAPRGGTVVVKITVRIPDAAFAPLQPEAVVLVPTNLTDPHPVVVEATDPTDPS
jgi:hypothetical protein